MSAKDPTLGRPGRADAPAPAMQGAAALVRRLEARMLLVALVIAVALSLSSPLFLTRANLLTMLDQSVVFGIVAIGMTFVVLTGGIDLSVGAVVGLSGIVLGTALQHWSVTLGILAAVATGAGIGLVSGLLVSLCGLAAFVVTLGVMAIARSLAYILSGQQSITAIPDGLRSLVDADLLGVPLNALCLVGVSAAAFAYLTFAKGGRTIYAVGSNREAARAAGLNTLFYSVLPYVLSGALAAVAACFSVGRIQLADPLLGNGMELDAIAAVVIGGTSLVGGRGSVLGTLIGVSIMVMIRNGLNILGISPLWQGTAIGTIIIAALLIERVLARQTPG